MLIIQIAFGIVLAVLVLAFLPQILSMSIWIALSAIAIAALIGIISFTSSFISEYIPQLSVVFLTFIILSAIYVFVSDLKDWSYLRKPEKIDKLKNKIQNLNQLLSTYEHVENNPQTLKQSLNLQQDLKQNIIIKIEQKKLEKLLNS